MFGHADRQRSNLDRHLQLDQSVARQRGNTDGGAHVAARVAK